MSTYIHDTILKHEMSTEDLEKWFSRTKEKFIYHIDTLYYSIELNCTREDWKNNFFIRWLRREKETADRNFEKIYPFNYFDDLAPYNLCMLPYMSFGFYKYHIGMEDCFDIFVAEDLPNESTPNMFVQIRSQYLWLNGTEKAYIKTAEVIAKIMAVAKLDVRQVLENRVDYAFHTNYIQSPLRFFPEEDLARMQTSQFRRWSKEGVLHSDETECDYITFGRRKSNNIFLRIYNKTKEVVEQNYKQYFFYIWLFNGLISKYDAYCYEKMFMQSSWSYQYKARLMFYLEFGMDDIMKEEITCTLSSDNPEKIEILARKITPELTIVTNIEFQTKRKFYYNIKDLPNPLGRTGPSKRIFQLLDLQPFLVDHLTNNVIRFIDYKNMTDSNKSRAETAYWWKNLQQCCRTSLEDVIQENIIIIREYQSNLDIEKQKILTLHKIASLAAYKKSKSNLESDLINFLNYLNDNDVEDYYKYKDKKLKSLANRAMVIDFEETKKLYSIANMETGEIY